MNPALFDELSNDSRKPIDDKFPFPETPDDASDIPLEVVRQHLASGPRSAGTGYVIDEDGHLSRSSVTEDANAQVEESVTPVIEGATVHGISSPWSWSSHKEGYTAFMVAVGGILITKTRTGLDIYLCTFVCHLIMACLQERDRPLIKPSDKVSSGEILRSICPPHVIVIFIISFPMGTCLFGWVLFPLPSLVSLD